MKVLFVSHDGGLGGAERSLLDLLAGLEGRGVERLLACPCPGPLSDAAVHCGVRVLPFALHRLERRASWAERTGFVLRWVATTVRLVEIIMTERPQLVHTNSSVAQLWSWPAIRLTRLPFVWHWRDFYDHPRLNRCLARGRGVSVAVSRSVQRFVSQQTGGACEVHLVPNGVQPPARPPATEAARAWRRGLGVADDEFLALALGQATPRKGFAILVRALRLARSRGARVHCHIACRTIDDAAHAHFSELVELAAQLGCGASVSIGPETADPWLAISAADAVIVPSMREPFGRVTVEAMMVGRPTVCSDVDGLAEAIDHGRTGLLVPAGDVVRLADALVDLASNPAQCTALAAAGQRHARETFSVSNMVDGVLGAYEQLLARPHGRAMV